MTTEISALQRVRIVSETTFNTDQSATPAAFLDLPVVEKSAIFTGVQDHLEPELTQQHVHAYDNSKMLMGKRSSTLALSTYLASTGAPRTGITTQAWPSVTADWGLGAMLYALMGGMSQGTLQAAATLTTAGSTTSLVNITAGHGTTLGAKARAYAVVLPNGTVEAREILSTAANTLTPKMAHSVAPGTGAAVYWATSFHLINGIGSYLASLQAIVDGAESGDIYVPCGMQGTFGIDIGVGAVAKITAQLQGAAWARVASHTLAAASFTNFNPLINMGSELCIGSGVEGGAAAGTSLVAGSVQRRTKIVNAQSTWQPGTQVIPVISPDGLGNSNIVGYKRARGRAVTGSFQVYDDTSIVWQDADTNRRDLAVYQQIGMTTAGCVLLSAPTVQISAVPQRADANGLYAQTVNWSGRNDAAIATPSGDLETSALRIHIF